MGINCNSVRHNGPADIVRDSISHILAILL